MAKVELKTNPELEALIAAQVEQQMAARLAELQAAAARGLSSADASFLIWTMGFVAGANLERDGARGERIFARCREIHEKLAPVAGNGS